MQRADGEFQGSGKAKVYIEQFNMRQRVVADARIEGQFNKSTKRAALTIAVRTPKANVRESNTFMVHHERDDTYSLFAQGSVILTNGEEETDS